ncbi:helix-turn-helix transcriptional regulator [Amycolatopsis rhizosphaerae]|nr:response regulator transcription factor [Amycolatopsis rhizosphaerae]
MSNVVELPVAGRRVEAGDRVPRVLRVAYFGRLDLVARGVEAVVTADPWLCWLGQVQDEEPLHLLASVSFPDVLIVEQAADPGYSVCRSLRVSAPRASVVVLADRVTATVPGVDRFVALSAGALRLVGALHACAGQEFATGVPGPPREERSVALTDREVEVLSLMAAGNRTEAIAAALSISPNTVKKRAHRLFLKLQVRDRAHAVAKGYEYGVLPVVRPRDSWPA